MAFADLAHIELLSEIDALVGELERWNADAPQWPPARSARLLIERLVRRSDMLRVRLESPLVVATLGGTGSGKSSLVNALVGSEVTLPGRQRPTTRQPIVICRSDITPQHLGLDPGAVAVVHRELPTLRDLVLIDCPDPDTTEDDESVDSNLARLREILPHCDVLLVVSTQEKYKSAKVNAEILAAASGAKLVFVQTRADLDNDIRDDWRQHLSADFDVEQIYFVDSVSALAEMQAGAEPKGDFARLLELLTRELSGTAARRIRRANFLELMGEGLKVCQERLRAGWPAIGQLEAGLAEERQRLAERLAQRMREELLASRRTWENRLLGEVAGRWGFSPFACLLRLYHGLGGLLAGATLWRVHSPAQLVLWGAWEGSRRWRQRRGEQAAEGATGRAASLAWDETQLRHSLIVIQGFLHESGLQVPAANLADLTGQSQVAVDQFLAGAAGQLQALIARLAAGHSGWFTRWRYELAWAVVWGALLFRFGQNFFWDSWLAVLLGKATTPAPVAGVDFFLAAGFTLAVWGAVLLWSFTLRLRRGIVGEINELARAWSAARHAEGVFGTLDATLASVRGSLVELERLEQHVTRLRRRLAQPPRGLVQKRRRAAEVAELNPPAR